MNQFVGIGLVAVGVMLAVYGIRASESLASDFSRFFTGSPTEKSVWLLIGAIGCVVVALVILLRKALPAG